MPLQIVVVDDDLAFRDALTRHFSSLGYEPVGFPSVERCLPHLARATVDLITLDLDMPRIDGMTLLAALKKRGHTLPILVISGKAASEHQRTIRSLGAEFLAKPFRPEDLALALTRALGGAEDEGNEVAGEGDDSPPRASPPAAKPVKVKLTIRERIQSAQLPTVDPRLASVQGMLMRPEAPSFEILAESLGEDPRLVAAVLRVANNTEYRGTSPTTTLSAAMARLGAKEVVRVALEVLVHGTFRVKNRELRVALDASWERSVACAHTAREIAELAGLDADEAYVFGLLHDVGRLAVYACLDGAGVSMEEVNSYADRYHESVGARLLGEWGMPQAIVSLARDHHDESRLSRDAALVALAHEFTSAEGPQSVELMERLGLVPQRIEKLWEERQEELP